MASRVTPPPGGGSSTPNAARLINTDGDPGRTIYVGVTDPEGDYDLEPGDVWVEPTA